jgi:hypothetical protein
MKKILTRQEQILIAFLLALLVVGGIVKLARASFAQSMMEIKK